MSRTIVPNASQARLILVGTALLLTLGMGIRQSFGLFLAPVTHDLAVTAADFTLALAVQNIVWGLSQALVGATADRFGLRITMMAGAAIYVVGLGVMAAAQGALALIVSGGLMGVALSCTATSLAMTACVRAVSPARRSLMLGVVSAAGSLGTLVVPLVTQAVLAREPWQIGILLFVLMAIAMLPAAYWAGGADKFPGHSTATTSMREVLGQAMRNRPFLVMSGAYFVCGLNLVFLTTHLPAYLAICGQDPMLSAEALATIGGVSAIGSLLTGWLGGRYPKHILLGLLYILRSLIFAVYFVMPPTPTSTLLVRRGDGHAVVAGPGAAHRRPGRRDFRHALYGDAAGRVLRRAPGRVVAWRLGRRVDLRPYRLLRRRVADRHADRVRRRCRPDRGGRSDPAAGSPDRACGRDDLVESSTASPHRIHARTSSESLLRSLSCKLSGMKREQQTVLAAVAQSGAIFRALRDWCS